MSQNPAFFCILFNYSFFFKGTLNDFEFVLLISFRAQALGRLQVYLASFRTENNEEVRHQLEKNSKKSKY